MGRVILVFALSVRCVSHFELPAVLCPKDDIQRNVSSKLISDEQRPVEQEVRLDREIYLGITKTET